MLKLVLLSLQKVNEQVIIEYNITTKTLKSMLKIKNPNEFENLRPHQKEEITLLLSISNSTGIIEPKPLLKRFLNQLLPLDIDRSSKKEYDVRKSMRYQKRKQVLKLWNRYLIEVAEAA